MTGAVKSFSTFLACMAFLFIFFSGYDFAGTFTVETIAPIIFRATLGAILFWLSGMIIGDIVLRGIVEDIDGENLDPLEGGFEQRIAEEKGKKKVVIVDRDLVKELREEAIAKEKKRDKKTQKR